MDSESLPAPPDDLAARQAAFFLDFDGTLARIVENPADARIDAGVLADLRILHGCANGALAIISGREIRDIDRRLGSFRPPVAGVHGLEWRLGDGVLRRAECNDGMSDRDYGLAADFVHPGPTGVMHYTGCCVLSGN